MAIITNLTLGVLMKAFFLLLSVFFAGQAFAGSWYSSDYGKHFDKDGYCSQYNHTDNSTCNTHKDNLKCDWNNHSRTCYEESRNSCPHGYWWSHTYSKCFKRSGHCSQYNHTDSRTCNTSKDHLRCDWKHSSSSCYAE